ncbi:MAG: hypothetical protein ACYDAN_06595 [Candidatus Limnocylindrales bacterium]
MSNGASVRLHSVDPRPPVVPVLLVGVLVGVVIGLGLAQVAPVAPKAAATSAADAASSSPRPSSWITSASAAPELLQAYYATRDTSAGLAPVVCTTVYGLACQGVPAHEFTHVEGAIPSPQIPAPAEMWLQLPGIAHVNGAGSAVDVLVVDDLSPALVSQVTVLMPSPDRTTWTDSGAAATPVSVNGAVAVMDLGRLVGGTYLILIRQVFSVPPDRYGLVETWKAIGVEVGA